MGIFYGSVSLFWKMQHKGLRTWSWRARGLHAIYLLHMHRVTASQAAWTAFPHPSPGRKLEPTDGHCPHPLLDPPVAAPHAGAPGAALLPHPQQAVQRPAEVAPQRLLCQAHPPAMERCLYPWLLGSIHGQEHSAQAG